MKRIHGHSKSGKEKHLGEADSRFRGLAHYLHIRTHGGMQADTGLER